MTNREYTKEVYKNDYERLIDDFIHVSECNSKHYDKYKELEEREQKLINYLERKIKETASSSIDSAIRVHVYQEILEKYKGDNNE